MNRDHHDKTERREASKPRLGRCVEAGPDRARRGSPAQREPRTIESGIVEAVSA